MSTTTPRFDLHSHPEASSRRPLRRGHETVLQEVAPERFQWYSRSPRSVAWYPDGEEFSISAAAPQGAEREG